jgi:hypothetical protein
MKTTVDGKLLFGIANNQFYGIAGYDQSPVSIQTQFDLSVGYLSINSRKSFRFNESVFNIPNITQF